ncbi:MAG: ATP synthase F1 subunit delta [Muribaculaceae bacterium]|nr:ATP synthase F1 subunit delta [Muribaculaceae bacterium]
MNDGLIPRRYAKALYKLALENGDTEQIYELLKPISKGLRALDEMKRVLINPHIPAEDKGRMMMQLVGAKPGSSLDKFILLVIRNNRAEFLRKIALAYVLLYREEHNIAKVVIKSAVELPDEKINKIIDVVKQRLGDDATLEVETEIDPELIGGFTVKIGDLLLDASVKNELNQLRLKLIS